MAPEVEPVVEPPLEPTIDRGESATALMRLITGMLGSKYLIDRFRISTAPIESPTAYAVRFHSHLLSRKKDKIGTVRAQVVVRKNNDDALVTLDWTRNAFGFWYRERFIIKNAAKGTKGISLLPLKAATVLVKHTVEGDIKLKSMNRMLKKIRKNPNRDRMAQMGMVAG